MSVLRLTATHVKYSLIETARVPMAVVGALAFPAISLLFFVVPQRFVADDPVMATQAVVSVCIFAIMASCLFNFGLDISERREKSWDPYLRTMPVPGLARVLAHGIRVLLISLLAVVPVLIIGMFLTAATATPLGLLAGFGALLAGTVPFMLLGLVIGYGLPSKAAIAIIMIVMMGLAFGGGLFLPPQVFPDWLNAISMVFPTRQARDLAIWAVQGGELAWWVPAGLAAWSVVLLVLALILLRRDQGRRFR